MVFDYVRPDRSHFFQVQEKPDLLEQPESAPEGMALEPEEIRKLEAEMVFFTMLLEHFGQLTSVVASVEVMIASNSPLHS
ncbi:MAG: hypothetical protein A2512_09285 [Deltaproteobacteria bacterium RIFOXYD12_FULL_56_24]|nr:MAG: hypothetical protein A2512_09285 [Deltaproteobacteria bacterium RIFOXYD12_FULL_56_24]